MRDQPRHNRNTDSGNFGSLLERLVFLPGALVLIYGCWLLIAS